MNYTYYIIVALATAWFNTSEPQGTMINPVAGQPCPINTVDYRPLIGGLGGRQCSQPAGYSRSQIGRSHS